MCAEEPVLKPFTGQALPIRATHDVALPTALPTTEDAPILGYDRGVSITKNEPAVPYFLIARAGPTGAAFWEVAWRHRAADGTTRQVKRRVGPAWLQDDGAGKLVKRRGRTPATHLDRQAATVAAEELMRAVDEELRHVADRDRERREAGATFREVAQAYLVWLTEVQGGKPSTLRSYRYMLAEPGTPHKRGGGTSAGHIMRHLGDLPAEQVSTRDIEAMMDTIARTGVAPRSININRQLVRAIYGYATKPSTFALQHNPAEHADKRREPDRAPLDYYSTEEVEALARALADGCHRDRGAQNVG